MKINNLASLRRETERLEYKLTVDKSKLKTDFQLLRFRIFEYAMKEVLGIFKRKPAAKKPVDKKNSSEKNISSDKTSSSNKSSRSKKNSSSEKSSSSDKTSSTEKNKSTKE